MGHILSMLAQEDGTNAGGAAAGMAAMGGACFFLLIYLAVIVVVIIGMWKVFKKAGQPGWMSLIPILNIYVLCQIAGKPWWWLILFLIPFVNIIAAIVVSLGVAANFGKSAAFAIGLVFLPFIFYPILGFGKATYQGAPVPKLF